MEVSKRGGARKGAGRPKESDGTFLGYRIPEETFMAFNEKCKSLGIKKAFVIKSLIEKWLEEST